MLSIHKAEYKFRLLVEYYESLYFILPCKIILKVQFQRECTAAIACDIIKSQNNNTIHM